MAERRETSALASAIRCAATSVSREEGKRLEDPVPRVAATSGAPAGVNRRGDGDEPCLELLVGKGPAPATDLA